MAQRARTFTFNSFGGIEESFGTSTPPLDLRDHFGSTSSEMEAVKKWMKVGYHPIEIWGQILGKDGYDLASILQMTDAQYDAVANNPYGSFLELKPEQVLEFCWQVGKHPAQLVPFCPDPRLSLPRSILLANIQIIDGALPSDEDYKLAMKAVVVEQDRYKNLPKQGEFYEQLESLLHYSSCGFYNQSVIRNGMKRIPIPDRFRPYENSAYIGGGSDFHMSNIAQIMMEAFLDSHLQLQNDSRTRLDRLSKDVQDIGNKINVFVGKYFSHLTKAQFDDLATEIVEKRDEWTASSLEDFLVDAYYGIGHGGALSRLMRSVNRHLNAKSAQPDFKWAAEKAVSMYCQMADREICQNAMDDRQKQIEQLEKYIPWLSQPEAAFVRSLVGNRFTISEWAAGRSNRQENATPYVVVRREVG